MREEEIWGNCHFDFLMEELALSMSSTMRRYWLHQYSLWSSSEDKSTSAWAKLMLKVMKYRANTLVSVMRFALGSLVVAALTEHTQGRTLYYEHISFSGTTATDYTGRIYLFLVALPGLKMNLKVCREDSEICFLWDRKNIQCLRKELLTINKT